MMRRSGIALLLALALVLPGCAARPSDRVSYGTNLMKGIRASSVPAAIGGDGTADMTAFAIELLKTTYDGGNTVVSPASAYIALSMVANGAAGKTLEEFETVLGAPVGTLNSTCKTALDALNTASDGVTLRAVDGIWYNSSGGFTPNRDFLQTNADIFGAAAVASDFSKPETLAAINGFVKDNTNGLIPSILDDIDPLGVMVLINTLHFKGNWESPFEPNDTTTQIFTTADSKIVHTVTMKQTYDSVSYFDDGDARGILLPYQGGRLAYMALLPAGDIADYLSAFTSDGFKALISLKKETELQLFIPKYETTGDYRLNEILIKMGLRLAFDLFNADFSEIGKADNNIYIDQVLQKVEFKLNEKGTEAAAATAVMASAACMPIQEDNTVVFCLDRPFIYALLDMETGTPLFLGVMTDPTEMGE